MKQLFVRLQELINRLNESNSINDKRDILRQFEDLKPILKYIYDPFILFNVTSANIEKLKGKIDIIEIDPEISIYDILDSLQYRELTGNKAIQFCLSFVELYKEHQELIYRIIDKNLKCRIEVATINSVWPSTIATFDVVLAKNYDDYKNKVKWSDGWYCSRKLDGVRCITIINGEDIKFYSREGKEFNTLGKIKDFFADLQKKHGELNCVLDGELCIINDNGDEDFQSIIKLYRKKDFTIPNPCYQVFDLLSIEEFNSGVGRQVLSSRYKSLINLFKDNTNPIITVLKMEQIHDEIHFQDWKDKSKDSDWEGLMLRKNVCYKAGRVNDLLKVKLFQDAEFIVKDVEFGDIRYISKESGLEITETMLSSVKIHYKNNIVSVGSGLSIEQRQQFYKNPENIIGKKITVKYFEESTNQDGSYSLRFPTIKQIWEE